MKNVIFEINWFFKMTLLGQLIRQAVKYNLKAIYTLLIVYAATEIVLECVARRIEPLKHAIKPMEQRVLEYKMRMQD